jgi:hypothetical protein
MPFGEYKGQQVHLLPRDYLLWLRDEVWLRPHLRWAVDYALAGKKYEPPAPTDIEELMARISSLWDGGEKGA